MARTTLNVQGNAVTVSFDDPPFLAMRWWGLARLQMTDEITREPLRESAALRLSLGKLVPRVAPDGIVGAVGRPWDILNPLERDAVQFDMRVTAAGYHERTFRPTVRVRRLQLTANASTDVLDVAPAPTGLFAGQRLIIGTRTAFEFATIHSVDLGLSQIRLTGNVSRTYTVGPGLFVIPDEFTPDPAMQGQFSLHRRATAITGRVTRNTGTIVPVAGAEVRVQSVWRLSSQPGAVPPPDAPSALFRPPVALLNSPLYVDYPAVGTEVRMQNRPFDAGVTPKHLLERAPIGARAIELGDTTGLGVGNVISIDADDAEREELLPIARISGGQTPTDAARVALEYPLRLAHAKGIVVRRLQPFAGVAPLRALTQEALAGDEVLLLDMTAAGSEGQVEVFHPGPPPRLSYHRVRRYVATSGANGVFRLPVARTNRLVIAAFGPPPLFNLTAPPLLIEPDYSSDENRVDFFIS